jgi:hypothetical protein
MSPRTAAVLVATVILLLSVSWAARTYIGRQRCAEFGMLFDPSNGCVKPPGERPIILERGLKRT